MLALRLTGACTTGSSDKKPELVYIDHRIDLLQRVSTLDCGRSLSAGNGKTTGQASYRYVGLDLLLPHGTKPFLVITV